LLSCEATQGKITSRGFPASAKPVVSSAVHVAGAPQRANAKSVDLMNDAETARCRPLQRESKNPPGVFDICFPNGWEILFKISHAYYTFPSTLDYKFLFNLQLWRSYATLSATTQFTSCAQNVHHQLKRTLGDRT